MSDVPTEAENPDWLDWWARTKQFFPGLFAKGAPGAVKYWVLTLEQWIQSRHQADADYQLEMSWEQSNPLMQAACANGSPGWLTQQNLIACRRREREQILTSIRTKLA